MRVAFVASGYENFGVESLSAQLKREGHEVRLFFDPKVFGEGTFIIKNQFLNEIFDLTKKIISQLLEWKPDIIGFSCMTHNYLWCLNIAGNIKKSRNIPIIFGGIHPTLIPQEVLSQDCVDMVAIGEADISFNSLLKNMERGFDRTNVRGIYFKKNGKVISNPIESPCSNLDSLQFLDKGIFYEKIPALSKMAYATMVSRGCLFSCFYCCNDYLKKLYSGYQLYRLRSVKHVIAELKEAKQKYNIKRIVFYDQIFPSQLSWLEEFSREYKKEVNLPFIIFYHFNLCDERRVALLKDANCYMMLFGLQSTSERIRRDICNRFETNDQVLSAVELCKRYKIDIWIDHIFGLPTETEEEQKKAVEFYRELAPNIIYSFWLVYYPKASIIDIALDADIFPRGYEEIIHRGTHSYCHEGLFIKDRGKLLKYELMLDLIPLVPKDLHKLICKNDTLLSLLARTNLLHFFLIFLSEMKLKDKPVFEYLKFLFSKKNIP